MGLFAEVRIVLCKVSLVRLGRGVCRCWFEREDDQGRVDKAGQWGVRFLMMKGW